MKKMELNEKITNHDRLILRDLAKKQYEYAHLPIMEERTKEWYLHNDLRGKRPMIHIEIWTFEQDIYPKYKCETNLGRKIERGFYNNILNYEIIDDDRVVPPYYPVHWQTWFNLFGLKVELEYAKGADGSMVGHRFKYVINDLKEDITKLGKTEYGVRREETLSWKEFLEDIFGDILPVKLVMGSLAAVPTQDVVHLMGMEKMIYSIVDYPDLFHELMDRISDDYIAYFKWLEKAGYLLPTTGYEHLHQGSFCLNNTLPNTSENLTTESIWGYLNSQESVGLSPRMYQEFVFPYYKKIMDIFGLVSYGCCEPVHPIWDKCLSQVKNLRKLSISPWCDEEFMGERLRGSDIIYHRKPSPNFIGVGSALDEDAWREHITKTLKAARGCHLEICQRDVYTIGKDLNKPRCAVQIIRELIDEYWQ